MHIDFDDWELFSRWSSWGLIPGSWQLSPSIFTRCQHRLWQWYPGHRPEQGLGPHWGNQIGTVPTAAEIGD